MFGNPETTPGGGAQVLRQRPDGHPAHRDPQAGDDAIGSRTRVKVVKNKVARPFRVAEFDIMYNEGISREGDLLDVGIAAGVLTRPAPGSTTATCASARAARTRATSSRRTRRSPSGSTTRSVAVWRASRSVSTASAKRSSRPVPADADLEARRRGRRRLGARDGSGSGHPWRCIAFVEDAYERANGIELFGGDSAAESAGALRHSALRRRCAAPAGAFVFYACGGPMDGGIATGATWPGIRRRRVRSCAGRGARRRCACHRAISLGAGWTAPRLMGWTARSESSRAMSRATGRRWLMAERTHRAGGVGRQSRTPMRRWRSRSGSSGARPRTRWELEDGCAARVPRMRCSRATLERLADLGYVDDAAFARGGPSSGIATPRAARVSSRPSCAAVAYRAR